MKVPNFKGEVDIEVPDGYSRIQIVCDNPGDDEAKLLREYRLMKHEGEYILRSGEKSDFFIMWEEQ